MNPKRVQRKRTKGYKLPANTICVNRPSVWGNPFIVGQFGTQQECVDAYELLLSGKICLSNQVDFETQKKYYEFIKNQEPSQISCFMTDFPSNKFIESIINLNFCHDL